MLHGPDVHRFGLSLRKGQLATVRISQLSGNVVAAAFDPDGQLIDLVDRSGTGFFETLDIAAVKTGRYAIQVALFEWNTPGVQYAIDLMKVETAGATPEARAAQLLSAWYSPDRPGAAVAVVQDGRTIFQRTIGLADVEHRAPITADTRFDLASVSKQFTAFAIAMLVDLGALNLDEDIHRYIGDLPQFDKPIRLRHLLDHTSGLRDWDVAFGLMGMAIEDGVTRPRILDWVRRQESLNFAPGSTQQYSNTGYTILAEILSRTTGRPFDLWLRENVFAPAGMSAVVNGDPQNLVRGKALSYTRQVPAPLLLSSRTTAAEGSSSVQASLNDMAKWVRIIDSGKIGGPGVKNLIHQSGHLDDGTPHDYGYGRWFGLRHGVRFIGHLGLAAGYRISVRAFPESDLAVIFMANDGNDVTYSRAETIENLFLGIAAEPVQVPDAEFTPPESGPGMTDGTQDYVGLYYSDELLTCYEIRSTGGGIEALHAIHGTVPLLHDSGEAFHSDRWFMPSVSFVRTPGKGITGFLVSSEGSRNMAFRRIQQLDPGAERALRSP